jgi:hypothetical protein
LSEQPDRGQPVRPSVADESLDDRSLGADVELDLRGEMIGGAGRDMDDLDQPGRRVIATEAKPPALLPSEPRERVVVSLHRKGGELDRAGIAQVAREPSVDEQQPRPRPITVDPGQGIGDPAARLARRDLRERRQVAPPPGFASRRGEGDHGHAAAAP